MIAKTPNIHCFVAKTHLSQFTRFLRQQMSPFYPLGVVHILRQPLEGGERVSQMLTIADEGGRGVRQLLTIADEGGRGGLKTSEIG